MGAEVLYRQMENTYRLELELPSVLNKAQKWKLDVVDTQGSKHKDIDVIYPHELLPLHHAGGSVLVFQELPRDRKKIGFPHRHHYAELTAFPSSPNSLAVPFMASIQNAM